MEEEMEEEEEEEDKEEEEEEECFLCGREDAQCRAPISKIVARD